MIPIREKEIFITEHLKEYLGCEVVMANQSAPAPQYPYVSYTIINPLITNNGTYGVYEDGYKRKEIKQTWSFTVQSNDDTESKTLALKVYDFFSESGVMALNDEEIVVQSVGSITGRDNLITIGYEYRNGLDVTFSFMNEVAIETPEIDTAEITPVIDY